MQTSNTKRKKEREKRGCGGGRKQKEENKRDVGGLENALLTRKITFPFELKGVPILPSVISLQLFPAPLSLSLSFSPPLPLFLSATSLARKSSAERNINQASIGRTSEPASGNGSSNRAESILTARDAAFQRSCSRRPADATLNWPSRLPRLTNLHKGIRRPIGRPPASLSPPVFPTLSSRICRLFIYRAATNRGCETKVSIFRTKY